MLRYVTYFAPIFAVFACSSVPEETEQAVSSEFGSENSSFVQVEAALHQASQNPSALSFLTRPDPKTGLTIARDFNPHPRIVEVILVANETGVELIPGVETQMLTFDGVFPAPQIIGDVGDTVVAHVLNLMDQDTTIHWHGVEIRAAMDGSFVTQGPIPPGGYFRYEFKMRNPALYWYHPHIRTDKQIESGLQGTLLMRDDDERDLLGISVQRERTFQLDDILLETEEADADFGQLRPFALDDDFLDDVDNTAAERALQIFNGRDEEGNLLLVNGRGVLDAATHPEALPTVYVEEGVPERWRFVNTSNGRFMRVSIPGQVLHQIGTDGGLIEHPIERQPIGIVADPDDPSQMISNQDPELGILLGVGERAEVVFVPEGEPGDVMYLEWHDIARGLHQVVSPGEMIEGMVCPGPAPCFADHPDDGKRPSRRMLRIVIQHAAQGHHHHHGSYQVPENLRMLTDIRGDVDLSDLSQALPVTFGHAPPAVDGLVTFFAAVQQPNALMSAARAATGPVPPPAFGPAPLQFVLANPEFSQWAEVGDTRYWEAINFTGNDHPLHAHGFFFQPVETRFVDLDEPANNRVEPFPYLALKDTIRLPRRTGALARSYTITRMAVRFSDDDRPSFLQRDMADLLAYGGDPSVRPGGWLDHCHIDEHAGAGMMTYLNVVPEGFPIPTLP